VTLILLAAVPFFFSGRAFAGLFAAGRGCAAALRGSEALGAAAAGALSALAVAGLGAPSALLVSALAAALAGAVLAWPQAAEAPAPRRRARLLAAAVVLVAVLAAFAGLIPVPPLWALSRLRFGLKEAGGALLLAALALLAELIGSLPAPRRALRAGLQVIGLLALIGVQAAAPVLRVRYVKGGHLEAKPLREAWTLEARAALHSGNVFLDGPAKRNFAWGPSILTFGPVVDQLQVQLDAQSASPVVRFRDNLDELIHLRFDITSLPFNAMPAGAEVLVVGAGGGRDLLAALMFQPARVTGLESNPHLVRWVCDDYAAFTGRICAHPKVRLLNAEARAWLAGSGESFDLIQISFADTGAAGSAGSYALTENFLYTREAMRSYLDHLREGGKVSFSHYRPLSGAPLMERLFLTALEALEERGSADPAAHLLLAATPQEDVQTATLIVGRDPFSEEDLKKLADQVMQNRFTLLFPSEGKVGEAFAALVPPDGRADRIAAQAGDIRPSEDDRPFFFLTSRPRGKAPARAAGGPLAFHHNAAALALPVAAIGVAAGLAPLFRRRRPTGRGAAFFWITGFGVVAAEVGMAQRLALVLGGPGAALTVVLAALMTGAALGAAAAQSGPRETAPLRLRAAAVVSALALVGSALLIPWLTSTGLAQPLWVRLTASLGLLAPGGFFLGLLGGSGLRIVDGGGGEHRVDAWGASALGAAAAGAAAWALAIAAGYGVVLWVAAAACAASLPLAPRWAAVDGGESGDASGGVAGR
jgi:SAM-dependent methyltransferase